MEIREGGLDHPAVIGLLRLHFESMLANSPPGTCHFLDLSGLAAADVSFWTMWDGEALLGCGAMKTLDSGHGEIKSMRTAAAAQRRGVAAALLAHIVAVARARGMTRLSLETGTGPAFEAAHALYARHGFTPCAPFGDYVETEFNRFLTRAI